jgi:hypothetical protein
MPVFSVLFGESPGSHMAAVLVAGAVHADRRLYQSKVVDHDQQDLRAFPSSSPRASRTTTAASTSSRSWTATARTSACSQRRPPPALLDDNIVDLQSALSWFGFGDQARRVRRRGAWRRQRRVPSNRRGADGGVASFLARAAATASG